jgi:hypothetical protein
VGHRSLRAEGSKNPKESRSGERSEHAGLSRNFSVNAFARKYQLLIDSGKGLGASEGRKGSKRLNHCWGHWKSQIGDWKMQNCDIALSPGASAKPAGGTWLARWTRMETITPSSSRLANRSRFF